MGRRGAGHHRRTVQDIGHKAQSGQGAGVGLPRYDRILLRGPARDTHQAGRQTRRDALARHVPAAEAPQEELGESQPICSDSPQAGTVQHQERAGRLVVEVSRTRILPSYSRQVGGDRERASHLHRQIHRAGARTPRRRRHKVSRQEPHQVGLLDIPEDAQAERAFRGRVRYLRTAHHHRLRARARKDALLDSLLPHRQHLHAQPRPYARLDHDT